MFARVARSAKVTCVQRSAVTQAAGARELVPGEPTGPQMKTNVPGEKSLQHREWMRQISNGMQVQLFGNYEKCKGNYFVDVDDNRYLDVFMQISSMPVGYNHPALLDAMRSDKNLAETVNRSAAGTFPSFAFVDRLQSSLNSIAPKGMTNVQPMMCGSCSNENAMKQVFMWYMGKQRGGKPFSQEEIESVMHHQPPGAPRICILSFDGAFHGRTFGCLNVTHTKAIHKLDIPHMDWPVAPFPKMRYPFHKHKVENAAEEKRCLEETRILIAKSAAKGEPVAGMIIEPVQAEGGDNQASPSFYRGLQQICQEKGIAFMVDEVQTGGGATGKMWAHEHWGLPTSPDIVSFAKKLTCAGYYYKDELKVNEGYRIYNTWVGDPSKLILWEAALNVIRKESLLDLTTQSGTLLKNGLESLADKYSNKIHDVRGMGGFCAVSCPSTEVRDNIVSKARNAGLLIGGCGDMSIRFRPALIYQPHHVEMTLELLDKALQAA